MTPNEVCIRTRCPQSVRDDPTGSLNLLIPVRNCVDSILEGELLYTRVNRPPYFPIDSPWCRRWMVLRIGRVVVVHINSSATSVVGDHPQILRGKFVHLKVMVDWPLLHLRVLDE